MNKRVLAKNFFIYSSGAALLRSLSFITAPITLLYLTPSSYGALSLLHSTVMVIALICGMGLRQVLLTEYFDRDESRAKQLVNDVLMLYIMFAVPILIMILYFVPNFVPTIMMKLKIESTLYTYLIIALMLSLAFFTFFVELFNQVMQYQQQARLLSIAQVVIAVCAAGLQVAFLSLFHWDIASIFFAQLLAFIGTVVIGFYGYWKSGYWIEFSIVRAFRNSWYYTSMGLSFMPSMLASWLMIAGNRFVIAYCGSMHDVGIYAVTDMLGQLFNLLVVTSLSNAYIPLIMRSFSEPGSKPLAIEAVNRKIMYSCMVIGFIIIIVGCTVAKPFLRLIFPPAYYAALDYMLFLLIGYLFYMGATFASAFVQWQKRIHFLSCSLLITAGLQVLLSLLLVPLFSIYGSVIACMIAFVAYFVMMMWFNKYLQKKITTQGDLAYKVH